MKKILIFSLIVLLAACGNDESGTTEKEDVEVVETEQAEDTETVAKESEHPFPTDTSPKGDATITINTPAGDSSEGNIPVLFVSKGDSVIQIGINYDNFDGSKETFVYINDMFDTTEQAGERYQSVLSLSEDNLTPGDYTVTAVQFTDNDPSNEPINLTTAQFKIEEAS
ncbi:hypothetical protein [Psychrobacillus sp. BM2]|uniref:hypothetical protein n=1 Tax=Psychrobacillus sp. BM2 TaxID=3400421 RepID=UPI003B01DD8D